MNDQQGDRLVTDLGPFAIMPMWLLSSGVSSRAIHLFGIMAGKYADREHTAFPSRALMAADVNCSIDSIDRALQELVDIKAIRVKRRQRASGDYTSNLYQLCFKEPPPETPEAGSRTVAPTPKPSDDTTCSGRTVAPTPGSRTDAPTPSRVVAATVAAPVPPGSRTGATTGTIPTEPYTHTARAGGPLIAPGESLRWDQDQTKHHRGCHPEVCKWRGTTAGVCLPAALATKFAEKLIGMDPTAALVRVIDWAKQDKPPAGSVASGDDFKFWRVRWDATMATASTATDVNSSSSSAVPSADETRAKYLERRA